MSGSLPTLITLRVSHFAEKARWGLERCGVAFTEEAHAPGPHRAAVKAAGGRGSVPCLSVPRCPHAGSDACGQTAPTCVDQSTPILRWADAQAAAAAAAASLPPPPPLFPPGPMGEEVGQLCASFDKQLGPAVRVWAYSHLLYTPMVAQAMQAPPVPALERLVLRCGGWLLMRRLMAAGMGITPENGAAALDTIKAVFDEVAARLADGRRFLAGAAFTAADLTFAALAAPAVGQPYAAAPGLDGRTPALMRRQLEELRAHPAGRFALRLWAEERGVVVLPAGAGAPAPKANL